MAGQYQRGGGYSCMGFIYEICGGAARTLAALAGVSPTAGKETAVSRAARGSHAPEIQR